MGQTNPVESAAEMPSGDKENQLLGLAEADAKAIIARLRMGVKAAHVGGHPRKKVEEHSPASTATAEQVCAFIPGQQRFEPTRRHAAHAAPERFGSFALDGAYGRTHTGDAHGRTDHSFVSLTANLSPMPSARRIGRRESRRRRGMRRWRWRRWRR